MTFKITSKDYVLGIWHVDWNGGNWMAIVMRKDGTEPWDFAYRFRYSRDGGDAKSWYQFGIKADVPEDEVKEILAHAMELVVEQYKDMNSEGHYVEVKAVGDKVVEELAMIPNMWIGGFKKEELN